MTGVVTVLLVVLIYLLIVRAAPVPQVPQLPVGTFLTDGYQTLLTFKAFPLVALWVTAEGGLKPSGFDGGEKIPISTMHNRNMRTFAARHLITQTDSSFKAFYDPAVLDDLLSLINNETTITQTWPDASSWSYFGVLQKFEPEDNKEGAAPVATCQVYAISRDPNEAP